MSRMIPLRRSDRRVEKSPFFAAISASSRSSRCSSRIEPFDPLTGAEEGCEVARRCPFVFADVVVFCDFERAWGTCLPLLDLRYCESDGVAERYADLGDGATALGNGVHSVYRRFAQDC